MQTPYCSSNPEAEVVLQMVTPRSIDRGGAVTGDAGEDQASATLLDGWDQSAVTT